MDDEDIRRELLDIRQQLTMMKLGVGVLLGGLRAMGRIDDAQQSQLLEAMSGMSSFAPTLEPEELKRTLSIIGLAAETVTFEDGRLST